MKTILSRFRNLFRRAEPEYEYDDYSEYEESSEGYNDVAVEEGVEGADYAAASEYSDETVQVEAAESGPAGAVVKLQNESATGGSEGTPPEQQTIHVPLAPVIAALPLELQSRVLNQHGDRTFGLGLDRILPQLASGAVSLTFGELRDAAPNVFGGNRDHDAAPIDIPLSIVIPHIGPELLARRHGPLQIEIPEEIVSPFADKGKGLAIGVVKAARPDESKAKAPAQPAAAPQIPTPSPQTPQAAPVPRPIQAPGIPMPQSDTSTVKKILPRPTVAPAAAQSQEATVPAKESVEPTVPKIAPPEQSPAPKLQRPVAQASNRPVGYEAPRQDGLPSAESRQMPARPTAPRTVTEHGTEVLARSQPSQPAAAPAKPAEAAPGAPGTPATPAVPGAPAPKAPIESSQTAQPAAPAHEVKHAPLEIALSPLADGWPDTLKQEIITLGLAKAVIAIPYDVVEAGLKRGRLAFPWKTVRSWAKPSPEIKASVHDPLELELPLRLVAPVFVAQKKGGAQPSPKVAVDRDIPNLFFGLPQPDTKGVAMDHSVNKPVDTNYYVWDDSSESVADNAESVTPSRTAGTEFVTRYATPNEVVSRAASLEGVVGAVIALPDGLMVASQLPPELNGDTLAAFLPHLFGKVSQCTQELRMGEVNNLNFTVGNVPWKIWRVNALYFAAFGKKMEPLPTAQLSALAAELDHKAKA